MTPEKKEAYRREFYKVMEISQPFGNEHHEQLFNWFISHIERLEEDRRIAYDIIAHIGTIIETKP